MPQNGCYICAAVISPSVQEMRLQMQQAKDEGANIVELRVDHISDFDPEVDLPSLLTGRPLPAIVTFRPSWEGGNYSGPEKPRLEALRRAVALGVEFVDVELEVAKDFIRQMSTNCSTAPGSASTPTPTRIIVSKHNYQLTPPEDELVALLARLQETGADVLKFATLANDINDTARVLGLLARAQVPTIALVMGAKGLVSRLLAPKFGGFLTFGSICAATESAPGQPTVAELTRVYRTGRVGPDTRIFGLIGNPVAHSKGAALHNAAMEAVAFDGAYVPFLVDNVRSFLAVFAGPDFAGFSISIPHKQTALECCDEVDPVAASIGAVNTIIRRPSDGKLVGHNTDWSAAIAAIEVGLIAREGPTEGAISSLDGRLVVVVGAGGTGRALAFGARQRGASVLIANRNFERAQELAALVGAGVVPLEDLSRKETIPTYAAGAGLEQKAPVLINTTSVGMQPNVGKTPVAAEGLGCYSVVFDAVYTPRDTRLLMEALSRGATPVSGEEMFIGQAAQQFELFTGLPAPMEVMRAVLAPPPST